MLNQTWRKTITKLFMQSWNVSFLVFNVGFKERFKERKKWTVPNYPHNTESTKKMYKCRKKKLSFVVLWNWNNTVYSSKIFSWFNICRLLPTGNPKRCASQKTLAALRQEIENARPAIYWTIWQMLSKQ